MARDITVKFADGSSHIYRQAPDDVTPDAVQARAEKEFNKKVSGLDGGRRPTATPPEERGVLRSAAEGALRGAAGIGNTLLKPIKAAADYMAPEAATATTLVTGQKKRTGVMAPVADYLARIPEAMQWLEDENKANPLAFGGGKVAAELAMTYPVGGLIAKTASKAAPYAGAAAPTVQKFANAVQSGGLRLGAPAATTAAGRIGNATLRTAGGATSGAATAGLVDPESAGTGALVGGVLPGAVKAAGAAGGALRKSLAVSPEVAQLAGHAEALGIQVPADRIADSKPLNALAATLNYVPFAGRAGTEKRMVSQLDRALSRTFGQDSDNVTQALRRASGELGSKFDEVLQGNTVKVDRQFIDDLAESANQASRELSDDGASIISKQVDDIIAKAGSGEIDGPAAYNIKRTLDRIGNRNTPEAFYARELKKSLMGALDRSLGPDKAAAFATTRKQYGNMLALENLAQNGAEGGVSVARLANMKNIGNKDLQELADISAQFLKTRESPHGALQRLFVGGAASTAGSAAGWVAAAPYLGGAVAGGRAANAALNSKTLRNLLMSYGGPGAKNSLSGGQAQLTEQEAALLSHFLVKSAPVLATPSGR